MSATSIAGFVARNYAKNRGYRRINAAVIAVDGAINNGRVQKGMDRKRKAIPAKFNGARV